MSAYLWPNQSAAANRRPAGQSDGSGNLSATVAADRAFPAAVAELGSLGRSHAYDPVFKPYYEETYRTRIRSQHFVSCRLLHNITSNSVGV